MHDPRSPERRKLACKANELFGLLPWNRKKAGLRNDEPYELWRYLSDEWLRSTDENDMLEILRRRIMKDPQKQAQHFRVEDVHLTAKLVEFSSLADVDTEYRTAQRFRWIRELGRDVLEDGQTLLTIGYLGAEKRHWVAFSIDGKMKQLGYGDSLGKQIPENILAAFTWWISKHSSTTFQVTSLPVVKQLDGFSCGILSKLRESMCRITAFIDTVNLILEHFANDDAELPAAVDLSIPGPDRGEERLQEVSFTFTMPLPMSNRDSLVEEAREHNDDDSRPTKQQKITRFFSKETPEEKEDRMARMWDELRATQDKQEIDAVLEAEKKAEKKREGNRIRRQKQRAAEKAKKPENGKKRVCEALA
ncbi:hypothetical protein M378DRAFT_200806 [Amanita muscaria Koide BX008]|uniref:Ubiquitin-like protease family profile domain-containing protein n=1 Tax=Amanita muscaria (strain Koide BX008) TaxID=946122 RepID=A0A0C2S3Y1_AMAMK|nr:hypothetical protein M378DRAFT_200806 [Amanita muscaria Koide BX008]